MKTYFSCRFSVLLPPPKKPINDVCLLEYNGIVGIVSGGSKIQDPSEIHNIIHWISIHLYRGVNICQLIVLPSQG